MGLVMVLPAKGPEIPRIVIVPVLVNVVNVKRFADLVLISITILATINPMRLIHMRLPRNSHLPDLPNLPGAFPRAIFFRVI